MTASPADLLATLSGIAAAAIREVMPHLRECRGIAGRIDLAEIKRRGISAPAVLVSRLGGRQGQTMAGPQFLFDIDMAAFVITRDAPGLSREAAAQAITQVLLRIVPDNAWRTAGVGPAHKVTEHSLITTDTEKNAISLWAVTWTQAVALDGPPVADEIALEIYLGQAPRIGADHAADYELIGGAP